MVSKTRKGMLLLTRKGMVTIGMILLTRKGMVTNVLNLSLDLSSYALFKLHCVRWPAALSLCCFQVCWDLQVSSGLVCLHFGGFVARKSFYACCVVQGAVGTVTVLAVYPFAVLKLLLFWQRSTSLFFCNLVSGPYAGSLGCARVCWIFVMIV